MSRDLWIVRYSHRYGHDCWPEFRAEDSPLSEEEVIDGLEDWEPDRDEYIEIFGPFALPVTPTPPEKA